MGGGYTTIPHGSSWSGAGLGESCRCAGYDRRCLLLGSLFQGLLRAHVGYGLGLLVHVLDVVLAVVAARAVAVGEYQRVVVEVVYGAGVVAHLGVARHLVVLV